MNLRVLTPRIHGLLDYAAAVGLIVLPFVLNLGATSTVALWLSVLGGVGLIGYSLLTDYPYGVFRALPFQAHLVVDLAAAAAFIAAPFVFGWQGLTAGYYFVMAAGVLAVVGLTDPTADETDNAETSVAG